MAYNQDLSKERQQEQEIERLKATVSALANAIMELMRPPDDY